MTLNFIINMNVLITFPETVVVLACWQQARACTSTSRLLPLPYKRVSGIRGALGASPSLLTFSSSPAHLHANYARSSHVACKPTAWEQQTYTLGIREQMGGYIATY